MTMDVWSLPNPTIAAVRGWCLAGDQLASAVDDLLAKIVPTPLAVLQLTKQALLRAYEAMGLRKAVAANLALSALLNSAGTDEQKEFDRIAAESGLRAALDWRDSRYGRLDEHL